MPLRQRLPYYGYRAGEALAGHLPRRISDAVAAGLAQSLVTLAPHRFDALSRNLRRVVPEVTEKQLRYIVRANVRNWARSWVDVMELRAHPDLVMNRLSEVTGLDQYHAAVAEGRGVVVISIHWGAWEAGLAAWNGKGGSLALLAEQLQPPELFERILGSRGALGVPVIPLDAAAMKTGDPATVRRVGAAAMREVIRHLKRGGVVAMAIDRDVTGGGEAMPFFGELAPIPIGAIDVAIRVGAVIMPVVLERCAGNRMHAVVYPRLGYDSDLPRDAEVRRVAGEALRICEEVIRLHPEQWHVLEPIWADATRTAS